MAVSTGIQETETATAVSTAAIMAATTIREKGRDVYHIEDNYMDKIIHKSSLYWWLVENINDRMYSREDVYNALQKCNSEIENNK